MHALLALGCFLLAIYGFLYMIGGPARANRFARGVNRTAQRGVEHVGRGAGRTVNRAANAYPMVAGIIVIAIVILVMSRC